MRMHQDVKTCHAEFISASFQIKMCKFIEKLFTLNFQTLRLLGPVENQTFFTKSKDFGKSSQLNSGRHEKNHVMLNLIQHLTNYERIN